MKVKDKIIEAGGKRYKLTKLDADAGSYVAFKLAGVALPLMNGLSGKVGILDDIESVVPVILKFACSPCGCAQKDVVGTEVVGAEVLHVNYFGVDLGADFLCDGFAGAG